MILVTAIVDLFQNKGSLNQKKTFTKGKKYEYHNLSSSFNNHKVTSDGVERIVFTNDEFYKYFRL